MGNQETRAWGEPVRDSQWFWHTPYVRRTPSRRAGVRFPTSPSLQTRQTQIREIGCFSYVLVLLIGLSSHEKCHKNHTRLYFQADCQ